MSLATIQIWSSCCNLCGAFKDSQSAQETCKVTQHTSLHLFTTVCQFSIRHKLTNNRARATYKLCRTYNHVTRTMKSWISQTEDDDDTTNGFIMFGKNFDKARE